MLMHQLCCALGGGLFAVMVVTSFVPAKRSQCGGQSVKRRALLIMRSTYEHREVALALAQVRQRTWTVAQRITLDQTIDQLAEFFQQDNPRFNLVLFRQRARYGYDTQLVTDPLLGGIRLCQIQT